MVTVRRRVACRVARAYAARVEGGAIVEQADAGSEPIGLLDCFIGGCIFADLLSRCVAVLAAAAVPGQQLVQGPPHLVVDRELCRFGAFGCFLLFSCCYCINAVLGKIPSAPSSHDLTYFSPFRTLRHLSRLLPRRPEGWNQALVEPPPFLSLSPGRRYSQLESNADVSPLTLTTPTTTASRRASWSTEGKWSAPRGRRDQRCGQRSLDDRGTSGSVSSGSRLTPPGQRTPRLSLASPPPLKNLAGGVVPPPSDGAAGGGSSATSETFPTPSGQHLAASDSTYGNSGFPSPPCRLGPTSCVDAIAADRTTFTNRLPGGAAESSSACASGGSSSCTAERLEDVPFNSDAVLPSPEAAAGEERHRGSRGEGGDGGGYPRNTVQQCAGRQRDGGGGDDDSKREHSGDVKKENNEDGENGEPGERRSSDGPEGGDPGGGAGGGDDDDGAGNRGKRGIQEDTGEDEEVNEDDDGEEEVEEGGAEDVEVDTFLRLSDVDFCEGLDAFKNEGTRAVVSTSSEALDSSVGGLSSCGGGENSRALSRHLSDFFRSPLSLDLTPQQRPSSILSLSEVQTGARLFGSMKSICSDDNGAFSISENGNFSDSRHDLGALCGAIGISDVVSSVDGPRLSTTSAGRGAASPPCTAIAEEVTAHHSPVAPPFPTEEAKDAPIAESNESSVTTKGLGGGTEVQVNAGVVLAEDTKAGPAVEVSKPESTEAVAEETEQPDGGGGESEEEWLAGDAANPSDDDNGTIGSFAVSTAGQDEGPKANQAASTPVSHWAGLNEDGSWRTEFARRAAGKAGEVEAERRRLAKIAADESWRSDAREVDNTGCHSRRDVRRDSVIRLQSGNVR